MESADILPFPGSPATEEPRALGQNIQKFLTYFNAVMPEWDGSWRLMGVADRAACIRALVQDHLDDFGRGRDWIMAGNSASFALASMFHEYYPLPEMGQTLPSLEIQVGSPEEAFAVQMRRVNTSALPPVPMLGAMPQVGIQSSVTESQARAFNVMDALALSDEVLSQSLESIGTHTQREDRYPLMLLAAFLVRWKGVQVAGLVAGGAIYRDIHNPNNPALHHGDVRLVYERMGPHTDEGRQQSPDGGSFVL